MKRTIVLGKAFHAFVIGIMFMLMMSLLKAQIPTEPPELVDEMEYFASLLQISGMVFGSVAAVLVLLWLLSYWGPMVQLVSVANNNSEKIGLVINMASFVVISYFIGWFWLIPC